MSAPVEAAGGVLWRRTGDTVEVCLVHRPRWDDWSLPKGKREPGESLFECAVREVAEETAVTPTPQLRLPGVRYTMADGRAKDVAYWSMRSREAGVFRPGREIDALWWGPVPQATARTGFATDHTVLAAFAALPPVTATVLLVHGSDDRPQRRHDTETATALTRTITRLAPTFLLAQPQCLGALAEVAAATGVPVEPVAFDRGVLTAPDRSGRFGVVCGTGSTIRRVMAEFGWTVGAVPHGGALLLAFADDRLIGADLV